MTDGEPTLEELFAWARTYRMTPEEEHEQRISFAYGNAKIENDRVTREMVEQAARQIDRERTKDGAG